MNGKGCIGVLCAAAALAAGAADYPIRSADLTKVKVTGGFWLPRFETNRLVTVRADFAKCEETGRIANFANAGRKLAGAKDVGAFKGIPFDDSDVYKVIEGAAYSLAVHPDPDLERYVDGVIAKIASAQEPDGYLYTARTLGHEKVPGSAHAGMMGPTRWANTADGHELYNVGHMYEAAVAYFEATGKRTLLDVACRSADLIDRTFGPGEGQLPNVSGHEEIELALVKLYRCTKNERYLKLAKHLTDSRGTKGANPKLGRAAGAGRVFTTSGETVRDTAAPGYYNQNHRPLVDQREAVGHAVRATYAYCALADMAALTGAKPYADAGEALWRNVTERKMYLTGGLGSSAHGERFGEDYELPNWGGYLETCAAIGNGLWNDRLFRLTGDARYVDVLERVIYNGFLSGVSLSGDEYFYPNPLAANAGYRRVKWFGCSCCPVNVVRFIPQIARFAYATRAATAYVNLFVDSEAELALDSGAVKLVQKTDYPRTGKSALAVTPARDGQRFVLNVRVPGWARGRPVPGDLYAQLAPSRAEDVTIRVNGAKVPLALEKGYCAIDRAWKRGDRVEIDLPMPVQLIRANRAVAADRGRIAVERGPVVYCAEACDNGTDFLARRLSPAATFAVRDVTIGGQVFAALEAPAADGTGKLTFVPYCTWANRADGAMQVFVGEPPEPTRFGQLPTGAVRPAGWLKFQMDAMTEGLVGRLHETSEYLVPSNGWLNANLDWQHASHALAGWEEQPYWLRSFVKLAVQTGNERCLKVAKAWVEGVMATADADGWFGPRRLRDQRTPPNAEFPQGKRVPDIWGHMVMCEALMSWYEATGDRRVVDVLSRFVTYCANLPEEEFLPRKWWGDRLAWYPWIQIARACDLLPVLYRLSEMPGGSPDALKLARRLFAHRLLFGTWADTHTVSFAERFPYETLYSRLSGDPSHRASADYWYDLQMAMWGQMPRGAFAADENVRDGYTDPRQGTESCTWAEFTRSFGLLFAQTGETKWADRTEDVVFNHAPCAYTPDWKELHYITAPNQLNLDAGTDHNYCNAPCMAAYSATDYRCCRHNAALTFPQFCQNLVMTEGDSGLVFAMYAPHEGRARVGGDEVTWKMETRYPFDVDAFLTITTPRPLRLRFRAPGWNPAPRLKIVTMDGKRTTREEGPHWVLQDVAPGTVKFQIRFQDYTAKFTHWPRKQRTSVDVGPLTYSLAVPAETRRVPHPTFTETGSAVWPEPKKDGSLADPMTEMTMKPGFAWNYGLLAGETAIEFRRRAWHDDCFTAENAPCEVFVKARKIPEWTLQDNQPAALQEGPAYTEEPVETIRLIPLGCARLRLSVFPTASSAPDAVRWHKVPEKTLRKNRK